MASLISILHDKILNEIQSVKPDPPLRVKTLVLDKHSEKLLYSVCEKSEVLDAAVSHVMNITDVRQPQDLEAMYLLMPTNQNVDRICSHFAGGKRMFRKVHLFFTEGLPEDLFARLTSSPAFEFLARLSELNINFVAKEAQVFTADMHCAFFTMYCTPRSERDAPFIKEFLMEDLRFTSRIIANTCITLNEFPYIRYYVPSHHSPLGVLAPQYTAPQQQDQHPSSSSQYPNRYQPSPAPSENSGGSGRWASKLSSRAAGAGGYLASSGVGGSGRWTGGGGKGETVEEEHSSKLLAQMVLDILDAYQQANPDFANPAGGSGGRQRPRGTLIITERAMDSIAPFVHEFTYQAMAYDLLEMKDDQYKYRFTNEKGQEEETSIPVDDKDELWVDTRHMHMKEAIDKLQADFKAFAEKNAPSGGSSVSIDKLKEMLVMLPQFKAQRVAFSKHLSLAEECMKIFEKRRLAEVANVEQCCATGVTAEGKTPKTLVEEMVPLLDSREISEKDKARIIALYIHYREGVPDEDRRRLYQHAKLALPERDAIDNLALLGTRVTRGPADKDIRRKLKSRNTNEEDFDLSRFKPLLKAVIEESVSGKLDQSLFPYLRDSPFNAVSTPAPGAISGQRMMPTGTPASLRSAKPSWHKAGKGGGASASASSTRERLLVFVAGGMTYSEMRTAYQESNLVGRDVYIGSTHIVRAGGQLTAHGSVTRGGFIDDLKLLSTGGPDAGAVPGGLRGRDRNQGGFQEYYDKKYFVHEPEPPARPGPGQLGPSGGQRGPSPVPGSIGPNSGRAGLQPPHLAQTQSMSSIHSTDSGSSSRKWGRLFKK